MVSTPHHPWHVVLLHVWSPSAAPPSVSSPCLAGPLVWSSTACATARRAGCTARHPGDLTSTFFLMGNPENQMDDDWGYHHFRNPPHGFRTKIKTYQNSISANTSWASSNQMGFHQSEWCFDQQTRLVRIRGYLIWFDQQKCGLLLQRIGRFNWFNQQELWFDHQIINN